MSEFRSYAAVSQSCVPPRGKVPPGTTARSSHRTVHTSHTLTQKKAPVMPAQQPLPQKSAGLNVQPTIPETYIEVLIVKPPQPVSVTQPTVQRGAPAYTVTTTAERKQASTDTLDKNLTNISDNHDRGMSASVVFDEENVQTSFMLPNSNIVKRNAGIDKGCTISDMSGKNASSLLPFASAQHSLTSSHVQSTKNGGHQVSADKRQPLRTVYINHTAVPAVGKQLAATQTQRVPAQQETANMPCSTQVETPSCFVTSASLLAASTPILPQSSTVKASVKSASSQTPDSGISVSDLLTPASNPQTPRVFHDDGAATCSSWANSEDSNQLILDLEPGSQNGETASQIGDDNSQDCEGVLDTSLSSMHWLGNYALPPKPPSTHKVVATAQLAPSSAPASGVRCDPQPHSRSRLKFFNPREISAMHAEYGEERRPPYSYMNLIQMALSTKRPMSMKLKDICRWIEDTFPFYKNHAKPGWRNSIRHNLSLYPCFAKDEKSKRNGGNWTLRMEYLDIDESATRNLGVSGLLTQPIVVQPAVSVASTFTPTTSQPGPVSTVPAVLASSVQSTSVGGKKSDLPVLLPRPASHQAFVLVPMDQVPAPLRKGQTPVIFIPNSAAPTPTSAPLPVSTATSTAATKVPLVPPPPSLTKEPVPKLPLPPCPKSAHPVTAPVKKPAPPGKQKSKTHEKGRKSSRGPRTRQKSDSEKSTPAEEGGQNLLQQAWLQASQGLEFDTDNAVYLDVAVEDCQEGQLICEADSQMNQSENVVSVPVSVHSTGVSLLYNAVEQCGQVPEKDLLSTIHSSEVFLRCDAARSIAVPENFSAGAASSKRPISAERYERSSSRESMKSASLPPILTKRVKPDGPCQSQPGVRAEKMTAEVAESHKRQRGRSRRKQVYPKQTNKCGLQMEGRDAEITITCTAPTNVQQSSGPTHSHADSQVAIEPARGASAGGQLTVAGQQVMDPVCESRLSPDNPKTPSNVAEIPLTPSHTQSCTALRVSPSPHASSYTPPNSTSTPIRSACVSSERLPSPISSFVPPHFSPCHLNNSFLDNLNDIFVSPTDGSKDKAVPVKVSPSDRVMHHHSRFVTSLTQAPSGSQMDHHLPELKTPPCTQKEEDSRASTSKYQPLERKNTSNGSGETASRKSLQFPVADMPMEVHLLDEMEIPSFSFNGSLNTSPPFGMPNSSNTSQSGQQRQQADGDHNLMHFVFDASPSQARRNSLDYQGNLQLTRGVHAGDNSQVPRGIGDDENSQFLTGVNAGERSQPMAASAHEHSHPLHGSAHVDQLAAYKPAPISYPQSAAYSQASVYSQSAMYSQSAGYSHSTAYTQSCSKDVLLYSSNLSHPASIHSQPTETSVRFAHSQQQTDDNLYHYPNFLGKMERSRSMETVESASQPVFQPQSASQPVFQPGPAPRPVFQLGYGKMDHTQTCNTPQGSQQQQVSVVSPYTQRPQSDLNRMLSAYPRSSHASSLYQDCRTPANCWDSQSGVSRSLFPRTHSFENTDSHNKGQSVIQNIFADQRRCRSQSEQEVAVDSPQWVHYRFGGEKGNYPLIASPEAEPKPHTQNLHGHPHETGIKTHTQTMRSHLQSSGALFTQRMTNQLNVADSFPPSLLPQSASHVSSSRQQSFSAASDDFHLPFYAHGQTQDSANSSGSSHQQQCLFDSLFQS